MSFLQLLLTSENEQASHLAYQQRLMDEFFAEAHESFIISLRDMGVENYCEWAGVTCDSTGSITSIIYSNRSPGKLCFAYVPSTVERLSVDKCGQHDQLDTRLLPIAARSVHLNENAFVGSINLRTLPSRLIVFNVASNNLTGSIILMDLPPKIERIFLAANQFDRYGVLFSDLPKSLVNVNLRGAAGAHTPRARPLLASDKASKKVFNSMQ